MQNYNRSDYNNSSIRSVDTISEGTALDICTKIYNKLQKYYSTKKGTKKGFECRSIARLFYWALQEKIDPPFTPVSIERTSLENGEIPIINYNQVLILKIAAPIASYHFIIVCKYNDTEYMIFSAYGARFIPPFKAVINEFNESCKRLILANYDNFNYTDNFYETSLFSIDWNRIIGYDLENYIDSNYITNTINNLINDINDKIEEVTGKKLYLTHIRTLDDTMPIRKLKRINTYQELLQDAKIKTKVNQLINIINSVIDKNILNAVHQCNRVANNSYLNFFDYCFRFFRIISEGYDKPIQILSQN